MMKLDFDKILVDLKKKKSKIKGWVYDNLGLLRVEVLLLVMISKCFYIYD